MAPWGAICTPWPFLWFLLCYYYNCSSNPLGHCKCTFSTYGHALNDKKNANVNFCWHIFIRGAKCTPVVDKGWHASHGYSVRFFSQLRHYRALMHQCRILRDLDGYFRCFNHHRMHANRFLPLLYDFIIYTHYFYMGEYILTL